MTSRLTETLGKLKAAASESTSSLDSASEPGLTASEAASGVRSEASPIREAILTKFAKFAPSSNNNSGSSHGGSVNSSSSFGSATGGDEHQQQASAASNPLTSTTAGPPPSEGHLSAASLPPNNATGSPSWLHTVKGRIAKTVEEKYTEYKSERDRRQRLRDTHGGSVSLDLPDDGSHMLEDAERTQLRFGSSPSQDAGLTDLPHSLSEGLLSVTSEGESELRSSQSQGLAGEQATPQFDSTAPLRSVPSSLQPAQSMATSEDATEQESSSMETLEKPTTEEEDGRTPVPSLNLTTTSPARERRRFTFSFLSKNNNSTNNNSETGSAPVAGEQDAAQSQQQSDVPAAPRAVTPTQPMAVPTPNHTSTPTRASLKSRMMGLMGKTPQQQNSAPNNASVSLKDLVSGSPSSEDPFGGGYMSDGQSPETEENSFAGGIDAGHDGDKEDDDDEVEAAMEADECLVYDPSQEPMGEEIGIEEPILADTPDGSKPYGEDDETSASGLLAHYWWLACLPICLVLFLQFAPLPSWLVGFTTGLLVGVPAAVYVMWRMFLREDEETMDGRTKFVDNVRKRVPKTPAIIVQEELERKHTWMNLWPAKNGAYDPLTYDVRRTMSVKVMLHGPWVELKFPKRNLPLRRMYDDGDEPTNVAFLEQKEVLDLTNCAIELLPENLPSKRIWSKKYPIRIRTKARKPCAEEESSSMKPKEDSEAQPATLIPDPTEEPSKEEPAVDNKAMDDEPTEDSTKRSDSPPLVPLESVFPDDSRIQAENEESDVLPPKTASSETDGNESDFEILSGDDSRTFYLFARTSREKEEWFNRLLVGAKFMQDWNHQNPPPERQTKPDPNYETYKVKEQRFKVFMENYFQARHAEGARKVHQMTKDDEAKQQMAREQVACLNIFCARMWHDLHDSKHFVDILREKITKKLLKVKIAQYFEGVSVTTLDLGQRLPQVLSCSLPWQDEMGLWVNLDIEYDGICQATVETQGIRLPSKEELVDKEAQEFVSRPRPAATLDSEEEDSAEEDDDLPENEENSEDLALTPGDHLSVHGSGLRVRMLEGLLKSDFVAKVAESEWVKKNITGRQITLQLQLHSLRGTLTLNMPAAPSDRIWYGFRSPPELELALRPCFGGRSLGKYEATFASVMRHLEKRLKQEFMKVLVYPNLDDEVIPLLNHGPYAVVS